MQQTYCCSECSTHVQLPLSPKIKTVTCPRCGDVSMLTDGVRRRFYPALHMTPFPHPHIASEDDIVSAWMPTHTRPVAIGMYECRFRTTEPHVLLLKWDGIKFVDGTMDTRVAMRDFLTWRGVLA